MVAAMKKISAVVVAISSTVTAPNGDPMTIIHSTRPIPTSAVGSKVADVSG